MTRRSIERLRVGEATSITMSKVIVSWSGGKDSCLACYAAISQGHDVTRLVNFISEKYRRVRFHGTEARLIQLQSQAIGISLLQNPTPDDGYEQVFREAVLSLLSDGVEAMVFGDIFLQEHKDWTERVCRELGIRAIEPLWGRDPEEVLREFIDVGFEATIVSAKSGLIDEEWVGRTLDREFLTYLKENHIEPCGENGEYHTFVTDGPMFQQRIQISESRKVLREGYWLLDTRQYQLVGRDTLSGKT